jgi:hypothetical protein
VEEPVKREYTLRCDNPRLAPPNKELAVMAMLLSQPSGRQILGGFLNMPVPMEVRVIHNTFGADPPDLEAFGYGFEVTDFPPDQVPKAKVRKKYRGMLGLPPYYRTGGNMKAIEEQSTKLSFVHPAFYDPEKEAETLTAKAEKMLATKDLPTNQILLLDSRLAFWEDAINVPVQNALRIHRPRWIGMIIAVKADHSVRLF